MSEVKEYTVEIEDLFLQFMVSEPELFVRCKGILDPAYFEDRKNKKLVKFLEEHSNEHNTLPLPEQIKAVSGKEVELIDNIDERHQDWFLNEFEVFCRHKALENEVIRASKLLEEKRYGEVEANIKEAVQIGLVKNLGTEYFLNPKERLESIKNKNTMISTGWSDIDGKLYGGTEKGTLTIFAGQSGAGKSLFLQNWAVNHAQLGLNVVYITLELSETLTSMRLDAMIAGYGTKEVLRNVDDVELRVHSFHKKHKGTIQLKQMPNNCTTNDIRAYLKEYEVQTGIRVDSVMIDYLDLLAPQSKKVSPSDLFVKDKYVSEEMRNLAIDLDIVIGTASQLNRSSHEELEFGHNHISGGISKINTADNVLGIFTTHTMKDNGRYQIQFLKTRSSSGVGSKVDLKFDIKTLRISDLEEGDASSNESTGKAIMDKLKQKGSIKEPHKPSVDDSIKSGLKLRDLLNKND